MKTGSTLRGLVGLLLVGVLVGCSSPAGPPVAQPPNLGANQPQKVGPEFAATRGVTNGVQWTFLAFRSNRGTCTELRFGDGSSGMACGDAVASGQEAMSVGVGSGPNGFTFVSGEVDPRIVLMDVAMTDGSVIHLPTVAAPAETGLRGRYFAAAIPPQGIVKTFTGRDADGQPVDVLQFSP